MQLPILSLFALFCAVLAQQNNGPNAFSNPNGFSLTAGKPTTLTWTPTTPGTVTLKLRSGANSDLDEGTVIKANIPNSGQFTYTPPSDTVRNSDYTIEIISDDDPSKVNYTPQFVIESKNTVVSITSSASSASSTASSAATSASSASSAATSASSASSAATSASSASSAATSTTSATSASSASSAASSATSISSASSHSSSASSAASKTATISRSSVSSASAASSSASSAASKTSAAATSSAPTTAPTSNAAAPVQKGLSALMGVALGVAVAW